jgi:hypothetical protein
MDCGVAPKSGETKDENLIKKISQLSVITLNLKNL